MTKPYYSHAGIQIFHGDCREILPQLLEPVWLVLTDPPYGIKRANGMGSQGYDGFGSGQKRVPRVYEGKWDEERPKLETLVQIINKGIEAIIWGGNYFAKGLETSTKWLVWDKCQTMPSFSDAELAWTTLEGNSTKMFRFNGSGLMAEEQERWHPTQKPVALMKWCIGLVDRADTILDPFMGSGTTLRAAKDLGHSATGIEIEERYCEIAAKRLSQEVFSFEGNS